MNDDDLEGSPDAPALGAWDLVSLGGLSVGSVVAGLFIGWVVDRHFGTSPVFVLSGIAIGIAGAIVGSWFRIKPFLDL